VPVAGAIDLDCKDALCELERRGYPVWRVRGYAVIDAACNQMANDGEDADRDVERFGGYTFHVTGTCSSVGIRA
jgi:glutathione peroxidase-family protein